MALDQLGIYNDALLLVGERALDNITEAREPRYKLDAAWDLGAVDFCLELIKPRFATLTAKLNTPSASSVHDLDSVHTLPSTYVTVVGVFSDAKLDQKIERYFIEGNTLVCEYATVYLRYTSDSASNAISTWSPSFARVVSAYLSRDIANRLNPEDYEKLNETYDVRIKVALELDGEVEPDKRAAASTTTLDNDWRHVYNDALQIMGLAKIVTNNDDSHRRATLDTARDASLVETLLEDIGWNWAISSQKSQYDPSLNPDWGYNRVHQKPPKMHRLDGIFYDGLFQTPLKNYVDEGDYIYTEEDDYYIKFVSTDFITTPSLWPPSFKKLVAAQLAVDTVANLNPPFVKRVDEKFEKRKDAAESIDAMQSPPRRISEGNWVAALRRGASRNQRP